MPSTVEQKAQDIAKRAIAVKPGENLFIPIAIHYLDAGIVEHISNNLPDSVKDISISSRISEGQGNIIFRRPERS